MLNEHRVMECIKSVIHFAEMLLYRIVFEQQASEKPFNDVHLSSVFTEMYIAK